MLRAPFLTALLEIRNPESDGTRDKEQHQNVAQSSFYHRANMILIADFDAPERRR